MTKNFTRIFLSLSAIVMLYASCKKETVKKNTAATTDYKALSSQVATTFYQAITGQYGSVDVSKGIKSPFKANAAHKGLTLNDVPSLCGFAVDTTYNYTVVSPGDPGYQFTDTTKTYHGNFHFVYTCTAGIVNGYDVTDSVSYNASTFNFRSASSLAQHYIVKALDQTYKVVSMDGTLSARTNENKIGEEVNSYSITTYTLTGLKVDFSSGIADIVSGTSTFHMHILPPTSIGVPPPYIVYIDYYGIIEYLGNHKAKLTINPGGKIYLVDLITGVATPV